MPNIGTGEIILLLLLALLLFGAKRLPEIGRSLGTGMREFKDSVTGNEARRPARAPASHLGRDDDRLAPRARNRLEPADEDVCPAASATARRRRWSSTSRSCGSGIFVCLGALVVGFVVTYAFHRHLLHWLNRPLPAHVGKPITLGVAEPFLTVMKISLFGALPARAARHPLAALGVLRSRRSTSSRSAASAASSLFAAAAARRRHRLRLLRRAAGGRPLPHELRQASSSTSCCARRTTTLRDDGAARDGDRLRAADLRARARRGSGSSRTRQLRQNRRIGYFVVACVARRAAGRRPGHDGDRDRCRSGSSSRARSGSRSSIGARASRGAPARRYSERPWHAQQ